MSSVEWKNTFIKGNIEFKNLHFYKTPTYISRWLVLELKLKVCCKVKVSLIILCKVIGRRW